VNGHDVFVEREGRAEMVRGLDDAGLTRLGGSPQMMRRILATSTPGSCVYTCIGVPGLP
jgi:hypothetical protein